MSDLSLKMSSGKKSSNGAAKRPNDDEEEDRPTVLDMNHPEYRFDDLQESFYGRQIMDESALDRANWHDRARTAFDPCLGPMALSLPIQEIANVNRKVDNQFPVPSTPLKPEQRQKRKEDENSRYYAELITAHQRYIQERIDNMVPVLAGLLLLTDNPINGAQRFSEQIEAFLNLASRQTSFMYDEDFGMGKGVAKKPRRK